MRLAEEKRMHLFRIRYRNTQGTLMRILTAVARRAIELPYVQAEAADNAHEVVLLLDVNPKQGGQLLRDWRAVVDVIEVNSGAPLNEVFAHAGPWAAVPHPPAQLKVERAPASA